MIRLTETAGPLYEKVKDYVLGNIGSGNWPKDRRLPSENELVSTLGVSRMTVHRALRELTSEGHLLRIQGVGTFVAPPKPQSALIEIRNIAGEIAARLGAVQNTVSAHLKVLDHAGLVRAERDGRTIRYVADMTGFRDLLAYLMEDCCNGAPELCQPVIQAVTCC
ncbi:MAG: GntR family transcriptional regulator [Mesorhizobium sp.]|nr:MAG: GntR family transcriptional regulator [Mesorhizobium sp.]